MNRANFFYKIKVTNLDTKAVYFHSKVPFEHVEMLKLSPNLEIDVVGQYRETNYEKTSSVQEAYDGIIS